MQKFTSMPSLSNVVAGSDAVLNCPVGLTYERLIFKYSGVTDAQLKNIEIRVNGKAVQHFADLTRLKKLNTYHGRPDDSGFFTIHFCRPELRNSKTDSGMIDSRKLFGFGTSNVATFDVTMTIDAGAAAPAISARAIQTPASALGIITKIKEFPTSFATAGLQEIDNIPRGQARIACIHLFKSDVTKAEVEIDSVKIVDVDTDMNNSYQKSYGKVPLTGTATTMDFIVDGDFRQALPTQNVQDFRVKPTIGAAGAMTVVVEYFDTFNGI